MAENEELQGYIRCPQCGKSYVVSGEDIYDEDVTYRCNECGAEIEVPFFTYCHDCEAIVGVDNGQLSDVLLDVASKAIGGFMKPWTALGGLSRLMDDIPSANGWGKCPFCNRHYIRCPKCNLPVEVRPGTGDNEVLRCPECGQRMRQP